MVCESLDIENVSLAAGTSWSPGQCLCWSCLQDTVLGVKGHTGHGLGVLAKDSLCVLGVFGCSEACSCKALVGGLYREGKQSKMFCSSGG